MNSLQAQPQDGALFPSKKSFFIFWSYILLFVSQGLLVKKVQETNIYAFNAPVIVLLTELVKLCICIGIYLFRSQGGGWAALMYDIKSNQKLLLLYMVPAFLYCLYNNLTFVLLGLFDVSTYYCLMQFRIVITAIIYQVLFKRQLNLMQWTSLMILTAGCLIKEYGIMNRDTTTTPTTSMTNEHNKLKLTEANLTMTNGAALSFLHDYDMTTKNQDTTQQKSPPVELLWSTGLILFQMFCSCFAGVYNEYLLKDSSTAKNADVILQNIFMYVDSIICNFIVFVVSSKNDIPKDIGIGAILFNLLTSPLVLILIFNNALSGLVASFFLKSLNSILKTFASALELFAITYLGWILFSDRIDIHTIIALVLVSLATIIYSRNPVSVAPPDPSSRANSRDGFVLLPMNDD
uniref:Putative UDP-sugar transporter protein SLC35A4 n=1 Tax=Aceria tosichella TaxID=561515 RepID=A0A6G1SQU3_9ACAR